MSDGDSDSSRSSEEPVETLVSGRAKRANAGNRLSHLLQHLDDEDVKADLLAEDETDQLDYSASGDEDGDVDLESSDDDEDHGPPKEGDEQADLEGERELQKQERAESKKKRKARELVRIQPLRKKVKIADTPTTVDESGTPVTILPRKRLEPLDHGPSRQSSRTQTVMNARSTEAKLAESQRRAEKTQESMRLAAERKAAKAAPIMTQADRMTRALHIEKVNARSLNRWEKSEQERLQIQKERLEAMRNRKLEGPVIRYWSGAVTWQWREGPDGPVYVKMKYKPRPKVEEISEAAEKKKVDKIDKSDLDKDKTISNSDGQTDNAADSNVDEKAAEVQDDTAMVNEKETTAIAAPQQKDTNAQKDIQPPPTELALEQEAKDASRNIRPIADDAQTSVPTVSTAEQDAHKAPPLLDGIDVYAVDSEEKPVQQETHSEIPAPSQPIDVALDFIPLPSMPPYQHIPSHLQGNTPADPNHIPAASLPLIRERATRTLLILESFPSLEAGNYPAPSRRASTTQPASSSILTSILLPESQPDLSAEERKYLTSKHKRETARERDDLLPPAPARQVCHISGKMARFRDPKTGLAYRDMASYKAIQRVLANGCQWSALLDVWSGIVGEGSLGRVAKGVPEGFWNGKVKEVEKIEEGDVIMVD